MSKRRPPRLERDPPWMRSEEPDPLSPAGDDDAWRTTAAGVTPLSQTKHRRHARPATPPATPKPSPSAPADLRGREKPAATRTLARKPPLRLAAPLVHGEATGVDARTLTKLRRGLLPIDASLDLHGLSQERAHTALARFLAGQQAKGVRCVRVVTGKGLKADWSVGTLRAAVPRWLNEPPLRSLVLAFAYARADDGGAGALYVLLRRKR
jgi:DNA-nicking Smr family endonuclease